MNQALPGIPIGVEPMAKGASITIGATLIGVLLVFSSSLQAQQVPCSYSVQVLPNVDCGTFEGAGTPTALNNLGHVVGIFGQCGSQGTTDSFLWTGGDELTIIQRPIGVLSFSATDINDEGLITGTAETSNAGQRGFIYNSKTGEWTQLPPPNPNGQGWSSAESINSKGQVCGYRSLNDGGDPVNPWMAFVWDPKTGFTDLGLMEGPSSTGLAISDEGTVAGWTGVGNANAGDNAFFTVQETTTVLPYIAGGTSSAAAAVNSSGLIAGFGRIPIADFPFFRFRAFVYSNESMIEIPPFDGFRHSFAVNVNESGLVIGYSRFLLDGTDEQRPFVWCNGEVIDVNQIIEPNPDFTMRFVESINETAQIAGKGTMKGVPVACILTPAMVGDLNGSCTVDVGDLLLVINNWSHSGSIADANRDGSVNADDLMIVIENWTTE